MALACAALTSSCATAAPPAPSPADFAGNWSYAEQCGWQHMANLHLSEADGRIHGTWNDGDGRRGRGQAGQMEGRITGSRLEARFCTEAPDGQDDECPAFGDWSNYFVLRDETLEWYQPTGLDGHDLYITLRRSDSPSPEITQTTCPEDFN